MKNFLRDNSNIISWLSGLGIPVAIVLTGWLVTSTTESSRIDTEYVRIALSILNSDNRKQTDTDRPFTEDERVLRQWAVRLLEQKSPEKFSDAERQALLEIRRPFGSPNEDRNGAVSWALIDALREGRGGGAVERPNINPSISSSKK